MSLKTPPDAKAPSLEQLLRRQDVWRGHSHAFVQQATQSSGYAPLDAALQHQGWPLGGLIEVCQAFHACEWWLFHPAIKALLQQHQGYIALLNPPALPFLAGLEQLQLDTRRLLVIQTSSAAEFVAGFTELSQCSACNIVLAWQPKHKLNYSALRKLHLSTLEHSGLYILFRHASARVQSSPANLRVFANPQKHCLQLKLFKQRGKLQESLVELPTPKVWRSLPLHPFLDGSHTSRQRQSQKGNNIITLTQVNERQVKGTSHDAR